MEELVEDKSPVLLRDLGMRFPSEVSKQKARYGLYQCGYCTNTFEAMVSNVTSGGVRSCGCQINKQKITHGLTHNQFYDTWKQMLQRCNSPKNKKYKYYGARGITVCEEWLDVRNFVAWAEATHPNTEGLSLDRIDNDKGYSPENCRWADRVTQRLNQRIGRNNTSGYVGVNSNGANWMARITVNNKRVCLGTFLTIEEAVQVRDNYIIDNELPNKLSTEY